MGKPAARLGDMTAHGGVIVAGAPTVIIGGKPAARINDMHVCPMTNPGSPPPPHIGGPIRVGSPTVLICGQMAARVGDMCQCSGPPDTISAGCPTVLIGDGGTGGGGAGGGAGDSTEASVAIGKKTDAIAANATRSDSSEREDADENHYLDVTFVDDSDRPISGMGYAVTLPDNTMETGQLYGPIKKTNIAPGNSEIKLQNLIQVSWSTDKAKHGDVVTIKGDTVGVPDGTIIEVEIWKQDINKTPKRVAAFKDIPVQGDSFSCQWTYKWPEDDDIKIVEQALDEGESPSFYCSARHEGKQVFSRSLTYEDTVTIELTNEDGEPFADQPFSLVLSNGMEHSGKLDANGAVTIHGVPPTIHGIVFPGVQGISFREWQGDSLSTQKLDRNPYQYDRFEESPLKRYPASPGTNRYKVRRLRRFLDTGIWGRYHGDYSRTDFGLISGRYILQCTWMNDENDSRAQKPTAFPEEQFPEPILKFLGADPKRGFILGFLIDNEPLTEADVGIVFLPDLHLHILKETAYDHFVAMVRSGDEDGQESPNSLDGELAELLNKVDSINDRRAAEFNVIQTGDCFDLWEAQALLINEIQRLDAYFRDKTVYNLRYGEYIDRPSPEYLENPWDYVRFWDVLEPFLDQPLRNRPRPVLRRTDADSMRLKILNQGILRDRIISRYPLLFPNGKMRFEWYRGNHDNMLANDFYGEEYPIKDAVSTPNRHRCGINQRIWAEHGHAGDAFNNDDAFARGFAVTRLNVLSGNALRRVEFLGEMFSSMREAQLERVKDIYTHDKEVRVIVIGHSHRTTLMDMDEHWAVQARYSRALNELGLAAVKHD